MSKIVWLCEFWGGLSGWDLKILYMDLENKKKILKKKWNGMSLFGGLENWKSGIELNEMELLGWVAQTGG